MKFAGGVFSVLVVLSVTGVSIYMAQGGFFPPEQVYECGKNGCEWVLTGNVYFSFLVLAGVIMLGVYMLPMIMRPVDFLANIKNYIFGFVCYFLMLPLFTNIFQTYSMANLHDVSWGNRPSSTGQEAFTANKANQDKLKGDYMVFRTNFVVIWLAVNAAYYIMIV